jgi:gas vesicle protein
MEKNNMIEKKTSNNKWIFGLFFGALLGWGVALLTASRSGEETRDMIAEESNKIRDKAISTAKDTKGKVEEFTSEVIDNTREKVNKLKKDGKRIKMAEARVIEDCVEEALQAVNA